MKKTYIAPAIAEMNIEAESMIAASLNMLNETVDTKNGGQYVNDRRGEWGNLLNK